MVSLVGIAFVVLAATGVTFYKNAFAGKSVPQPAARKTDDMAGLGVQIHVEFENDHVQVVRYHFAPHATIPMHDAPELAVVWLTDVHIKLTSPDGTTRVENYPAGATQWKAPQKHTGVNLSDTPLEFISIQLQGSPGGMQR
jgi:quercetin dioxygenase-like cupin family protein